MVETLADLDVELAQLYKTYLAGLNAESRRAAVEEQRSWLKKRNCLSEAYNT